MNFQSVNPANEEIVHSVPFDTPENLERKIEKSQSAFLSWSIKPIQERAELILKLSSVILKNKNIFVQAIHDEMGKPLSQALSEVEKCAQCAQYYAKHGPDLLKPLEIKTDYSLSRVEFAPLGTVLAIMPWNFPFWQVFRCAIPTLLSGNTFLLKHAPSVPLCTKKIEDIFNAAGFPNGVFQNIFCDVTELESIISHPAISATTLTGSVKAGSSLAALSGKYLKKCVLELGGSDPFIVFEDADLESAISGAIAARFQNTGQSCIAAKRFLVAQKIADSFVNKLKLEVSKLEISPMARLDLLENIDRQVQSSIKMGATLITGGKRESRKGYYYQPTILDNVTPGMPAFEEETFGPVASIIRVAGSDEEFVKLANQTSFGLGASVWTKDIKKAQNIRIQAGQVFINTVVKSDSRLPFGGVKQSGFGRELGKFGIREFVNVKTVCVA